MRWPNSVIVAIGVKFSPCAAAQADGRHDGVDEAVETDERAVAADGAAAGAEFLEGALAKHGERRRKVRAKIPRARPQTDSRAIAVDR